MKICDINVVIANDNFKSPIQYKLYPSDKLTSIIMEQLQMKTIMTRRYYVGAESISKAMENTGRCPALKTLDEALTEAKSYVESGADDVRYVVEVVKIVRRASQPVIVEDVR